MYFYIIKYENMKKLITILLLTALTSCGVALEPPKSNTDYKNIIGKPIKIDNVEVAQYDFPKDMNWEDAKRFCTYLGKGWRLPTKEELNYTLYENRVAIGGFSSYIYWSSKESDYVEGAWAQNFSLAPNIPWSGFNYKVDRNSVRAVRSL